MDKTLHLDAVHVGADLDKTQTCQNLLNLEMIQNCGRTEFVIETEVVTWKYERQLQHGNTKNNCRME
jgi:hypothetical protein